MMPNIYRILFQSIRYSKKPIVYQFCIIVLLSAVITGSLLTGSSVKESLKRTASERLGNTGLLITSGIRYFDPLLVNRLKEKSGLTCTGILEVIGNSQSFSTQKVAFNTHIFGINKDFFVFQGNDSINIKPGEAAINRKLADFLGIRIGEDLIIHFQDISDIPSDAPFAASGDEGRSVVLKVGLILNPEQNGNFSLSISQITPMNLFVNLTDLKEDEGKPLRINRLIISKIDQVTSVKASEMLKSNLKVSDLGLRTRLIKKVNGYELKSDRIFIDETALGEIKRLIPSSAPVITYLGNRFSKGGNSTPYSFVSALPSSLYPQISSGNTLIINKWMAEDMSAKKGDTINMSWYSPDSLNRLIERSGKFTVQRIEEIKGIWSDSLLMPDFPGIAGKESCSEWDAGVPVKMNEIRRKDEDYWNRYRGTPKAFMAYEEGKELWGNNFGPATAIRFPSEMSGKEIESKLDGSVDPGKFGLYITDIHADSQKAANESVDFGTLLLSLGFFLILASFILLSFSTSSYFDTKKKHVSTLFALGFRKIWIIKLLYFESGLITLAACFAGAFSGYIVAVFITTALNTVWSGAVQTDTLETYFKVLPLITGFISTFIFIMAFMFFKVKNYLASLNSKEKASEKRPSVFLNRSLLLITGLITLLLIILSFIFKDQQLVYSFAGGTLLLITFILAWVQLYIGRNQANFPGFAGSNQLSRSYYLDSPLNAITPVLFIAAGIFSIFITGANRMDVGGGTMKRADGTGGYLFWCENAIPVKEDLNSESARKNFGIDDPKLGEMSFVQIKRRQGNDASCLNLNHVSIPPVLGLDPSDFISKNSFSFSRILKSENITNPWQYLQVPAENNTFYGIADQTVLEWGLKLKTGDTLIFRSESGIPVKIIIAAGLKSSVFQGNLLVGIGNFSKYYPSVSGSSVMLVDGNSLLTDQIKNILNDRFEKNGINIEKTTRRLASFNSVTNTYLSVFGVFGAFGMVIGIAGLGFVLIRSYNQRKSDFALMLATGFHLSRIRKMIISEQIQILSAGIFTGVIAAIVATLPSLRNNHNLPWQLLILMIMAIAATGLIALLLSVRSITKKSLVDNLKKE